MPRLLALLALAALAAPAAPPALAAMVVPVRAIRAQSLILPSDLDVTDETIPGAAAAIEDVAGLEAKVTLYPGRPILASQIGPPALVERNALVRMNYRSGALAIMAEGRSLDRAGIGERVRVMNLQSKQIVTGTVAEDGTIEVGQ